MGGFPFSFGITIVVEKNQNDMIVFLSLFGNTVSQSKSRYCWGGVLQITYVSAIHLVMIIQLYARVAQ